MAGTSGPIGEALLALTRCGQIEEESVRSWRSVTFSGNRHAVRLRFDGIEEAIMGEALIEELAEADPLNLAGCLVVDVELLSVARIAKPLSLTVEFSVLTLDNAETAEPV